MAVLIIGEKEEANIAAAIARARAHPIPISFTREVAVDDTALLRLSDRKPGYKRPREPEQVLIPMGYRACVSVEEQPAGMCLHLSISVERADPKLMPSVEALRAIAKAFGIDFATARDQGMTWMEEYEPGRHAVNLLKLIVPRQEGHT
jgi:hypothetical protein